MWNVDIYVENYEDLLNRPLVYQPIDNSALDVPG